MLTVEVDDSAQLIVDGAPDELHRLAINLLQNALVHTPEGTAVEASARREGGRVAIEVSDEGPGIPAALRARIFDRFVRGAGDRSGGGGSGLGLAIVRAVAESHGGSVEISDSEGGGARFVIRMPAAAGAEVTPPLRPAAPSAGA